MLKLTEHFEYYHNNHLTALQNVDGWETYYSQDEVEDSIGFGSDKEQICISIKLYNKQDQKECSISSSYFIGLDRLPQLGINVYIEPKLNRDNIKLDYVKLLMEALTDSANFDHLEGLIETKFDEEWIEVESDQQLLLTPFLIAQYLSVVKDLVKRGLKKSYYTKKENLKNRLKGKVLVGEQIKNNLLKNRLTQTVCQYQEFGLDTELNQFLKYVLQRVQLFLSDLGESSGFVKPLEELLRFCKGGFQQVSDVSFPELKIKENNPFYKNYNVAISLGNQILKLQANNISRVPADGKVKHPRFWIDMSKLFELYVFKKLRERFPEEGEVQYHIKYNRQEPDFVLNTRSGIKAIVDAKYKPRYKNGNPSMEDARQLSGYARLKSVYNVLDIYTDDIIPCYLIYPKELIADNSCQEEEEVNYPQYNESIVLLEGPFRESSTYKKMYLQELEVLS